MAGARAHYDQAMGHLGKAIHVIQDAACPAHMGFQRYTGNPAGTVWHTIQESRYPSAGTAARRALEGGTRWAFDAMVSGQTSAPALDPGTGRLQVGVSNQGVAR